MKDFHSDVTSGKIVVGTELFHVFEKTVGYWSKDMERVVEILSTFMVNSQPA